MKLILGNPGSGKTKKVLELSAKNDVPILCESPSRVERLLVKAAGYGYKIPTPIYFKDLTEDIKEVYIDDVEILLRAILSCKVLGFAVNTTEDIEIINLD